MPMYPLIPNLKKLASLSDEPPTIYSLLNSYVNFENPEPVKIKNLASAGREMFFDFDYPLTENITKEDFEVMILNHFMMRRIGYETVTAFKLELCVKLNEIMPMYNKMFDALEGWGIFDGETITRDSEKQGDSETNGTNTAESTGNNTSVSDRRFSDTPQNKISEVKDGEYVSEYNYDQNTDNLHNTTTVNNTNNTSDSNTEHEVIKRSVNNKFEIYKDFLQNRNNVYTMIFKDLDQLFYQLV